MATARKLPSGSWRCQVYSHTEKVYDQKAKVWKDHRVYESFTSDDPSPAGKREAERMAAEFAYSKDRLQRSDYTFQEAAQKYVESKKNILSPSTLRSYETLLRNAYPTLLNVKTKRITQEMIQKWANQYTVNHSPKSVSNAHGFISAILGTYEPSLHLRTKLPEKRPPVLYVPTDADIKTLLSAIAGTEMEKAVLLAAFGTLRRGEICALEDTDIHGNIIFITKSLVRGNNNSFVLKGPKKESSYRRVEYPDFVIEKFKGIKGRLVKMYPEDISKNFGNILKKAGLHHFRFHDLRHYSASIMHALGVPDQYIMERGGWKTDRVLKSVYRNVMADKKQEFTEIVNSHFETMQHEIQHEMKKVP